MGFFQKFVILSDIIGFFLITRYPYIDLFCILMRHGSKADDLRQGYFDPSTGRVAMAMELIKQNFELFVNGVTFFVAATGMTLDMQRRNCGLIAAIHVVCSAIFTCFEHKTWSEFMLVSIFALQCKLPSPLQKKFSSSTFLTLSKHFIIQDVFLSEFEFYIYGTQKLSYREKFKEAFCPREECVKIFIAWSFCFTLH